MPAVATKVTEPPAQNVVEPLAAIEAEGNAFTFTVADTLEVHPFAFVTVYVMIVEPAVTEVTNPVASTVATLLLDEDQTPPVVASANCVVAPIHTSVEPVIAATTGSGFTIT